MGGMLSKFISECIQKTPQRFHINFFQARPDALIQSIAEEWLTRKEVVAVEKAIRFSNSPITLFKPLL